MLQACVAGFGLGATALGLALLRGDRAGSHRLCGGGLLMLALVFAWLVLDDASASGLF
ncbi:MAG: hypothetical protein AB7P02_27655 [Alphaproteobacteria bacterium]